MIGFDGNELTGMCIIVGVVKKISLLLVVPMPCTTCARADVTTKVWWDIVVGVMPGSVGDVLASLDAIMCVGLTIAFRCISTPVPSEEALDVDGKPCCCWSTTM